VDVSADLAGQAVPDPAQAFAPAATGLGPADHEQVAVAAGLSYQHPAGGSLDRQGLDRDVLRQAAHGLAEGVVHHHRGPVHHRRPVLPGVLLVPWRRELPGSDGAQHHAAPARLGGREPQRFQARQ
jgi:hypothetical protein